MTSMLLMAALAALALLVLVRPWWQRSSAAAGMRRRAANVAAYRTRLAEIEADQARGVIDAETAAQLRGELDARLLEDTAVAEETPAPEAPRRSLLLPAVVAAALPVFAGVWYYAQGSWQLQQLIETARADPQAGQQLTVDAMVQRLEQRLEREPGDAEGWAMLGRSYAVLQRFAESASAYAKASVLAPENPDWMVEEGEALALARERDLQGRPQQLFEAALKIDPNHAKALWYAGLAAAQAENYLRTLEYWQRLRQLELPPEIRETLDERLKELAQLSGESAPALAPAQQSSPAASEVSLQVSVDIAEDLRAKLDEGQSLFVFAKADGGPPMPLAVQRFNKAELPAKIVLDDSMAMMPQFKLSSFDRWVVTARVSRSGGAQAESGDLEGSVQVSRAQAGAPVSVTIDRVVP